MNAPPRPGEQGFSLIELIIFILVIGMLAVGFMQAISGGLQEPDLPRKMTQAAMLVQEKVEQIYYNRSQLTGDLTTMTLGNSTESPVDSTLFADFSRSVSYTDITKGTGVCPSAATGCRLYTVKVTDLTDASVVYAQADLYLVK